jgi:ABC-type maltose transport system permease subunit
MISVSFRLPAEQFSRNIIPNPITFQNYLDLFEDLPNQAFLYLTFNSFKLSILTVIGQVLTCAMAAFVFAIVKFKGRDFCSHFCWLR